MKRLSAFIARILLLLASALFVLDATVVGRLYPAVGVIVVWIALWRKVKGSWPLSDAFGSARVADLKDLQGMRGDSGLIMGRTGPVPPPSRLQATLSLCSPAVASEDACGQFFAAFGGKHARGGGFIRIKDFNHLLTFSPAGGGKTVNTLAPNLFSYPGNCVVVDVGGGELFKLTARHRAEVFGHQIIRIDPARLFGPGHCLNPLHWLNPASPFFIDQCRDMANMIVTKTGHENDPHWHESAENMIASFIALVRAREGDPTLCNLRGVRRIVTSRIRYTKALEVMEQDGRFDGLLQDLGGSLDWHVEEELASVMATVQRATHVFQSPLVAQCTDRSTWDPANLSRRPMTVYIVCKPEFLVPWAGWIRITLGSIIRRVTEGLPTEHNKILFLVDECAHIGSHMRALEDGICQLRKHGIRMWLFFQSLQQMQESFGNKAGTILDNLTTQQYFGITSYETAEMISKRAGVATILNRSKNENTGTSHPIGVSTGPTSSSRNSGSGVTLNEQGRPLFYPDEVLREKRGFLFHMAMPVVLFERIKYYADPAFRRGGTGKSSVLGIVVKAVGVLLLACVLTLFVACLPVPAVQQPGQAPAFRAAGRHGRPLPYRPRRSELDMLPPSYGGRLIEIK